MTLDSLYEERAALMDKKYHGGLSAEETVRLSAIDIELDELEMQQAAPYFERLEALVLAHETCAAEAHDLLQAVKET